MPVTLLVASLALSLTGCAAGEEAGSSSCAAAAPAESSAARAGNAGYEEQCEVLSDGEVTEGEYLDALGRMTSCFEEQGYQVTIDERPNPVDGLIYDYGMDPGDASDEEFGQVVTDCSHRYLSFITEEYARTHDHVMDPQLVEATTRCLDAEGHRTPESVIELADFIAGESPPSKEAVEACVAESIPQLWPDWEFSYSFRW